MEATRPVETDVRPAAFQAYTLLRIGFTVAPILFGLDKFFNWTVDWTHYLAPWIGAPVVALWLAGIIVNLLTAEAPEYYDIALRDFGLMLGALTLARLAWAFRRSRARPA